MKLIEHRLRSNLNMDLVKPGILIKLAFQTKKGVREYCWVRVLTITNIEKDIDILGEVVNSTVPTLQCGGFVDFKPEHVIYIWDEEE